VIEATKDAASAAPPAPPPPPAAPDAQRVVRIKPSNRFFSLDFRELWHYRELWFILAWRDIKVRYKQTLLGVAWALIQPFTTMVVFTLIFNKAVGVKSEYGVPYPLFSFSGLLPWFYFTSSLTLASTSVMGNATLVTKVYFPRLLMPLASITVPFVDLLFSTTILAGMFIYYGRAPHWHTVAVPLFLLMALVTALGMGLWLSALSVRYRDVPYAIPFLIQLWLFASPVLYPVNKYIPEHLRWLFALNPMTGVIDGVRWCVLGKGVPHYLIFTTSGAVGLLLLVTGVVFFRRTERTFADVI
jgi:lipopolysaccharide transport system permease protein